MMISSARLIVKHPQLNYKKWHKKCEMPRLKRRAVVRPPCVGIRSLYRLARQHERAAKDLKASFVAVKLLRTVHCLCNSLDGALLFGRQFHLTFLRQLCSPLIGLFWLRGSINLQRCRDWLVRRQLLFLSRIDPPNLLSKWPCTFLRIDFAECAATADSSGLIHGTTN